MKRLLFVVLTALVLAVVAGSSATSPQAPAAGVDGSAATSNTASTLQSVHLRGTMHHRHLQGGDFYQNLDFTDADLTSAELGAALMFLAMLCLLCCLCSCICGGGGRGGCSLWDIVALICIWDLCCDRDGAGGFMAM